jgi:hypothetical protein
MNFIVFIILQILRDNMDIKLFKRNIFVQYIYLAICSVTIGIHLRKFKSISSHVLFIFK